jgi:methionyl aminopeptidase
VEQRVASRPQIKDRRELAKMREAGRVVSEVLHLMRDMMRPGVKTSELDVAAAKLIRAEGGEASFLGYNGFPAHLCISLNEEVVHGIPGGRPYRGRITPDRELREGDLVSLDCGVYKDKVHGDSAVTFVVGEPSVEAAGLLEACRRALHAGIAAARAGRRLGEVSAAIEGAVRAAGSYGVVEQYVGHGIGRALHEPPQVPNYVGTGFKDYGLVLEPGLVLALEPMVNLGTERVRRLKDGWTVVTRDGRLSAHFEHTIAVTDDGAEILTALADGRTTH